MTALTPSQRAAVLADGNVLLEAGAGSGKTSTLVERCLHQVLDATDPISLDEILMVTFTEAAAAEMRHRIRQALNKRSQQPQNDQRLAEQLALLDQSHIGTLHSFCLRLIREHFNELGLDPQTRVLDESEARSIANDALSDVLNAHYEEADESSSQIRNFIRVYGSGKDTAISELVLSTHRFLETLPNRAAWIAAECSRWEDFDLKTAETELAAAVAKRCTAWLALLRAQDPENSVAVRCTGLIESIASDPNRREIDSVLQTLTSFDGEEHWPRGTKKKFRDPIRSVFNEARFYAALAHFDDQEIDPLQEDFERMQPHAVPLLRLVSEFTSEFTNRKRQQLGMDFSDLEQFSLKLLVDPNSADPTPIALKWRNKFRQIYVDEYQDINEAQDSIIAAVSGAGEQANRFLVGDVKQSIYGFRLARPDIFLRYADSWRENRLNSQVLPLSDNFRSHESVIQFVNGTFSQLLREPVGGIRYNEETFLKFGDPDERVFLSRKHDGNPRVEFICRLTKRQTSETKKSDSSDSEEDFTNAEQEAQIALHRLVQLKESKAEVFDRTIGRLRPVEWADMAVLLRATSSKAEIYARVFALANVPLLASRRGFFDTIEISDLVSLLTILDNPLQDIPLLAVLRSPIVGLSPDELVKIRVGAHHEPHFWTALLRFQEQNTSNEEPRDINTVEKLDRFINSFQSWRIMTRRGSLSQCLEHILETTQYLPWLGAQPNGAEGAKNVQRLLDLLRHHDSRQGRGLHRFLEYVRLVQGEGDGPEPATSTHANAVRLMTIHASKGLEFPVVVLADLGKSFRQDRPVAGVLVDEELGICPAVFAENGRRSYPSLGIKQAERNLHERMIAEELRLLYVAMTRACDHLFLVGSTTTNRPVQKWDISDSEAHSRQRVLSAKSMLDFIGPLMPGLTNNSDWFSQDQGVSELLAWRTIQAETETPTVQPLPSTPESDGDAIVQLPKEFRDRIEFKYPFLEATQRQGKTTVTRLRKQFDSASADDETGTLFGDTGTQAYRRARSNRTQNIDGLTAAETGIAYHTFFQKIRLDQTRTAEQLKAELERLVTTNQLSENESAVINVSQVLEFWNGSVGQAFLAHPTEIRRELPFTLAFSLAELSAINDSVCDAAVADDLVVVQGIADLVSIQSNEIWILDFKSDRVDPDELDDRVDTYRPQVQLYQQALERICRKPVTRLWLHFLHLNRSVEVNLAKTIS